MPFTKGDKNAGSKDGVNNKHKNRPWREALDRAIKQSDGKALRKAADSLLSEAAAGNIQAIKELGDRVDGKVIQEVSADVDTNLTVVIKRFDDSE